MYKRIFKGIMTVVGFTLLFTDCAKTTEGHISYSTTINLTGSTLASDQKYATIYYSTDGGTTWVDGVLPSKAGQTFKAQVFDNTNSSANGFFLTNDVYVADWSQSNPKPTSVDAVTGIPTFTYTGSNAIKVTVVNKFCTYDAASWSGAWGGDEVGACCGGTDANNFTATADPNTYVMDNFWGDGVDATITFTPSTSFLNQIVTIPLQTTSEGGTASGVGTYDQCAGTFTLATEYTFPGLTDLNIIAMARGNGSASRMYAATPSAFFFSANGGSSWTVQSADLGGGNPALTAIRAITTPLVTANTNVYVSTSTGVYHSADRGVTWAASNSGLTDTDVTALQMVSTTKIYAGTANGGVFISNDGGATWAASNTGLTNTQVVSLYASGSNVYVGTQGGNFYSSTAGATWTQMAADIKNVFTCFAATGTEVYAGSTSGLFHSTDNGSTWTVVSAYVADSTNNNTNVTDSHFVSLAIQVLPLGTFVYGATENGGVIRSSDGGVTWTASDKGLGSKSSVSLVSGTSTSSGTDPNAFRLFYGTTAAGMFITTNQAKGWANTSNGAKYDFQYNFHR